MASRSRRSFEVVSPRPSLLENLKVHPVSSLFSLGMDDYVDSDSFANQNQGDSVDGPSSKRPKSLRLKKKGKENDDPINDVMCFEEAFSTVSEAQYKQLAKGFTPKNTEKCTNWALNNFSEWCNQRNAQFPDGDQCPEDLLTKAPYDNRQLCYCVVLWQRRNRRAEISILPLLCTNLCVASTAFCDLSMLEHPT